MTKYRVVGVREETPEEKAQREWFAQQALASPDNLENAARLLIGLVSGLISALFAVLTIAAKPLPNYLGMPAVRWLGVFTVVLLLVSLAAALLVVLPRHRTINPAKPATEAAEFGRILRDKAGALTAAVITFGLGLLCLGAVLVIGLLFAA